MLALDHVVVAARDLAEGVAWVEARLGVPLGPGGRHAAMGTHNRLLSLGPGRYLEVIAVDPEAPPPGRARWFALDTPEMAQRLAAGPAPIHWVIRSDDIAHAVAATAAGTVEILDMARGEFRWRIGVPASGRLSLGGTSPTVIQWQGMHPTEALPDSGCRLERLVLGHPQAAEALDALRLAGLSPDDPVTADRAGSGIVARIRTPRGIVELAGISRG